MIWHLNQDISYCQLDGRLFFLDIKRDRYFQLSRLLEQSFLHFLESPSAVDIDVKALLKHGLLSSLEGPSRSEPATELDLPKQSLLETFDSEPRPSPGMISGVFIAVAMMRWQLKRRQLKSVLDGLDEYRSGCAKATSATHHEAGLRQRTVEAATVFNHVRPYVPIETCCLVDSLSMVRFLANFGLAAHLVMGVACDPFSAHAWAQYGHLVLNDTVGNAQAYVPIRVI
jgi:hypothetical protein